MSICQIMQTRQYVDVTRDSMDEVISLSNGERTIDTLKRRRRRVRTDRIDGI